MNLTKDDKILIKMINNRLDQVTIKSKELAKMFGKTGASFAGFRSIVEEAKITPTRKMPKVIKNFVPKFNPMLDTICSIGIAFAKNNDSDIVPVDFIEIMITESKENFETGMKNRKK